MSYSYRVKKRKCCHFILKYLIDNDVERDPSWEPLKDREKISINTFVEKFGYDYKVLYPAVFLLDRNNHIEYQDPNGFLDDDSNLELLPLGKEAFFDGSYLQENAKDLSQTIELNTKWIIPIISLIISLIALTISILKK